MLKHILAGALGVSVAFAAYTHARAETDLSDNYPAVHVTDYDRGGVMNEYIARAARWNEAGTEVQIKGSCWSACAMYLTLVDKICVHRSASFHFHAPYYMTARGKYFSYETTQEYLTYIPAYTRRWIEINGGLGRDWLHYFGASLRHSAPFCDIKR